MIDLDQISDEHKREAIAGCFSDDNPLKKLVLDGIEIHPDDRHQTWSNQQTKAYRWAMIRAVIWAAEQIGTTVMKAS